MPRNRSLVLATLVALCGVANGEVYKYEDADGNVVFTDEPPADVNSEIVDLPSYEPPSFSTRFFSAALASGCTSGARFTRPMGVGVLGGSYDAHHRLLRAACGHSVPSPI